MPSIWGRPGLGQSVFDAQGMAALIKLMRPIGLTLSTGKEPTFELFAVVGQQFLEPADGGPRGTVAVAISACGATMGAGALEQLDVHVGVP